MSVSGRPIGGTALIDAAGLRTEVRQADQLLDAARRGGPKTLVVVGPTGSGRTAVVNAIRNAARASDMMVMTSTSRAIKGSERWRLLYDLASSVPPIDGDLGISGRQLLRWARDGVTRRVPGRGVIVMGVREVFTVLASSGSGLVVVVDDAHLADGESLEILVDAIGDLVAASAIGIPLALVVAIPEHSFPGSARFAGSGFSDRIVLGPVDVAATAVMIEAVVQRPVAPAEIELIARRTGGSRSTIYRVAETLRQKTGPLTTAVVERALAGAISEDVDQLLNQGTVLRRRMARVLSVLDDFTEIELLRDIIAEVDDFPDLHIDAVADEADRNGELFERDLDRRVRLSEGLAHLHFKFKPISQEPTRLAAVAASHRRKDGKLGAALMLAQLDDPRAYDGATQLLLSVFGNPDAPEAKVELDVAVQLITLLQYKLNAEPQIVWRVAKDVCVRLNEAGRHDEVRTLLAGFPRDGTEPVSEIERTLLQIEALAPTAAADVVVSRLAKCLATIDATSESAHDRATLCRLRNRVIALLAGSASPVAVKAVAAAYADPISDRTPLQELLPRARAALTAGRPAAAAEAALAALAPRAVDQAATPDETLSAARILVLLGRVGDAAGRIDGVRQAFSVRWPRHVAELEALQSAIALESGRIAAAGRLAAAAEAAAQREGPEAWAAAADARAWHCLVTANVPAAEQTLRDLENALGSHRREHERLALPGIVWARTGEPRFAGLDLRAALGVGPGDSAFCGD
jgi:hypothetical protein